MALLSQYEPDQPCAILPAGTAPANSAFTSGPAFVFNTAFRVAVPGDAAVMDILLPADRIQQRVAEMARQIAHDYRGRPVTIVGVLTGCLMFLADLVRHLDLSLRI